MFERDILSGDNGVATSPHITPAALLPALPGVPDSSSLISLKKDKYVLHLLNVCGWLCGQAGRRQGKPPPPRHCTGLFLAECCEEEMCHRFLPLTHETGRHRVPHRGVCTSVPSQTALVVAQR